MIKAALRKARMTTTMNFSRPKDRLIDVKVESWTFI